MGGKGLKKRKWRKRTEGDRRVDEDGDGNEEDDSLSPLIKVGLLSGSEVLVHSISTSKEREEQIVIVI